MKINVSELKIKHLWFTGLSECQTEDKKKNKPQNI